MRFERVAERPAQHALFVDKMRGTAGSESSFCSKSTRFSHVVFVRISLTRARLVPLPLTLARAHLLAHIILGTHLLALIILGLIYSHSRSLRSQVAFDSGKNIKHIQGKAVVIYDNGGSEVGCGIVPGDPYKEHDMVSQYSHETRKNGKRVTVEFTISTGYEFVDFKNKIVVLNDSNGAPVGCGVLKDEES